MICSANQLTGFCMMGIFAFSELMFHFLKSNFQWYHTKLHSVKKPEYFVLTHAYGLTLTSFFIKIIMGNCETCPVITSKPFFWRVNYGTPFLTIWRRVAWNQFHISKVYYLFVFITQTNNSVLNWMILILTEQNIILKMQNQDFPPSVI